MYATIPSLGAILNEWRIDQGRSVSDWANLLLEGGLSGQESEVAAFIHRLEADDTWMFPYSCDAFDEFFDAVNQKIRRPGMDDHRWRMLFVAFMPHRRALVGVWG